VSPKLSYNLDTIADFSSIPAGRYRAKLKKCTQKNAKASGQPMLEWEWEILVGANNKATKAVKGRQARTWTSLQPQALSSLKEHLKAFDLSGKVNKSTDQLIGKIVVLVFVESISQREGHEGEPDSRVAVVLPKDAPLVKPGELADDDDDIEDEEDEEEVDEGEVAAAKAAKKAKKKAKKAAALAAEAEEDEDDEDYEDEEEDEEEPPVKKRKKNRS